MRGSHTARNRSNPLICLQFAPVSRRYMGRFPLCCRSCAPEKTPAFQRSARGVMCIACACCTCARAITHDSARQRSRRLTREFRPLQNQLDRPLYGLRSAGLPRRVRRGSRLWLQQRTNRTKSTISLQMLIAVPPGTGVWSRKMVAIPDCAIERTTAGKNLKKHGRSGVFSATSGNRSATRSRTEQRVSSRKSVR